MHTPLWKLSATALARAYRDGSLSPGDVARACLARLDSVNPRLNAVVVRRDEAFLREADAATQRFAAGQPLSLLDGIPVSVKDSLYTADMPTSWGTPALRQHATGEDEFAVARVRAAGAPILGKTNVPEFALEGYTDNPIYGPTGNPWNPALTPGGSSGGAVAAVAAGIGPLAIAQDGGGSIRRPVSHTGLVGLKPSLSSVPREHALPTLLLDFEIIGPVARSVADTRLLFNCMRGPAGIDRLSLAAAHAAQEAPRTGPLRILYVERLGDAPLDPQIAASVSAAVDQLADLGHQVRRGPLPLSLDGLNARWPMIGQIGLASLFEREPEWARQASPRYREMAGAGRRLPAALLWQIVEEVRQLRRASATLFSDLDVIVMPSAAALPWPREHAYPGVIDGQEVGPRGHAVYTGWVNAAGLPALAVPCAPSPDGLPIGMQMIGPYGADDMLLTLGEAFEAQAPWAGRWPEM